MVTRAKAADRSGYFELTFSAPSGGGPRGCRFTYPTLEEILLILRQEYLQPGRGREFVVLFAGQDARLEAQAGKKAVVVDVADFVTVHLKGKETFKLSKLVARQKDIDHIARFSLDEDRLRRALPAVTPSLDDDEPYSYPDENGDRDEDSLSMYGYSSSEGWAFPYPIRPEAGAAAPTAAAKGSALGVLGQHRSTPRQVQDAQRKLVAQGRPAVPAVLLALEGAELWHAERLLKVLGQWAFPEVLKALAKICMEPMGDDDLRRMAAEAAARLPGAKVDALLISLFADPAYELPRLASFLMRERPQRTTRTIAAAMASPKSKVRLMAIHLLTGRSDALRWRTPLLRMLDDRDGVIRLLTARLLQKLPPAPAIRRRAKARLALEKNKDVQKALQPLLS